MTKVACNQGIAQTFLGAIDFGSSPGSDIRALLVKTNSTIATEPNATFVSSYTNLDEWSGGNYARQALSSKTVTPTTVPDRRVQMDCANITFAALLDDAGQKVHGVLFYEHNGADTVNFPIAVYFNGPAFSPTAPDGTDFILGIPGTGWLIAQDINP